MILHLTVSNTWEWFGNVVFLKNWEPQTIGFSHSIRNHQQLNDEFASQKETNAIFAMGWDWVPLKIWLVVSTPPKNISQWEGWHPIYYGK